MFKYIYFLFSLFIFYFNRKKYFSNQNKNKFKLREYINFIEDCKKHQIYEKSEEYNYNINPYISVCLPVFNMEKYIEKALISILNQSFKNYEIIIINDNSHDNTENILKKYSSFNQRIKIITHSINKGVYFSRIESILISKGKYILLMDPDDAYLTKDLFLHLFNYNSKYNLDIIEFSVYHQREGRRNLFQPKYHLSSHYHNFSQQIIYQPELSTIIFNIPNKNQTTYSICRNIWNKLIRKDVLLKMNEYIGKKYLNEIIIRADDMLMNIIINQFAQNYSNIEYPGYLYNLREISMSRGEGGTELKKIRTRNIIHYFQIFYRYIKDFYKDRAFIYNEIKRLVKYIYFVKEFNLIEQENNLKLLLNDILDDIFSDTYFKTFVHKILLFLEEDELY